MSRAEGFLPGERVSFFFTAPDGTVNPAFTQEVRANDAGEAAITRVFRSTALTGRWFVTAFGQTSLRADEAGIGDRCRTYRSNPHWRDSKSLIMPTPIAGNLARA